MDWNEVVAAIARLLGNEVAVRISENGAGAAIAVLSGELAIERLDEPADECERLLLRIGEAGQVALARPLLTSAEASGSSLTVGQASACATFTDLTLPF